MKKMIIAYVRINGVEKVAIDRKALPKSEPKKAGMKVLFTAQDILAGRV